jgi:hypothetical protein
MTIGLMIDKLISYCTFWVKVKLLLNEKPFKARTAGADIDESS